MGSDDPHSRSSSVTTHNFLPHELPTDGGPTSHHRRGSSTVFNDLRQQSSTNNVGLHHNITPESSDLQKLTNTSDGVDGKDSHKVCSCFEPSATFSAEDEFSGGVCADAIIFRYRATHRQIILTI